MEDTTTTNQEERTKPPQKGELTRPVSGRVIGGVAAGLSEHFNVSLWLTRAAFVITCFFGGLGFALYVAGWVLIRSEDESDTPAERFFSGSSSPMGWIGVLIIVVGALIIIGNLTFFSGEFLVAVGLIAVGVLMYTGRFSGPQPRNDGVDDKEGVQQMTETLIKETTTAVVDSPVDGSVPPPPPPPTPAAAAPPRPTRPPKERSILGRLTLGLMLLGMGVLAVLDQIDAVPIEADPRHYVALAITILGVGLLVGALAGRARWLILIGLVLIPLLLFSPAFEYDWSSDTFDVLERPTQFAEVLETYEQDAGNLVIDLTRLPWNGETLLITANVDLGNLELRVPENVSIRGQASVDVGRAAGPGQESVGIGDPTVEFNWDGDDGLVELFLTVDVGNVEVHLRNPSQVTP